MNKIYLQGIASDLKFKESIIIDSDKENYLVIYDDYIE